MYLANEDYGGGGQPESVPISDSVLSQLGHAINIGTKSHFSFSSIFITLINYTFVNLPITSRPAC